MANNYKLYVSSTESPLFEFSNDSVESLIFENAVDVVGNELSTDILEVSVFFDDTDGTLRTLPYATPVYFYNNGNYAGKYYITKVERTAPQKFLLHATSMIGLIGKEQFYGGFYTRARFEDVLHEILFSNDPVYANSKEYKAECLPESRTSSVYGYYGVNLVDGINHNARKMRLQIAFTFGDAVWAGNGELQRNGVVVGRYDGTYYSVKIYQTRSSTSSPTYFYVQVIYGTSSYSVGDATPLIGAGSYVSIDVNPTAGTLQIDVDYVKYDDPTTTGQLSRSETIAPWSGNTTACLDVAFSPNSSGARQYGYAHILWDYYRVYNEDGTPRIDAAITEVSSTKYVYNKISGVYATPTKIVPYGQAQGYVADLKHYLRSQELLNSIEMDEAVANAMVNGWLPISTRRDALHHLLFANNVSIIKSESGKLLFTGLTSNVAGEIFADDIYTDQSEEPIDEAKKISVTEHTFVIPESDPVDIFDNTGAATVPGDYIAVFNNAPIYDTPVGTNLTIKSYNCNCAVVSGRGKITGTPYNHTKNDIVYQNDDAYDGVDISVGDVSLITATNSDGVMEKLKAFYCAAVKKVKLGVIYREQRCGVEYSFPSLFSINNTGHLSKMSSKASSFIKSDCEFVSGYTPPSSGGYGAYQIVDYNGEWSVPQTVREREYADIRLILIGSGHNGTNGGSGDAGSSSETGSGKKRGGNGGNGGSAGLGGNGGDVYQITVDVANIAKITVEKSGNNTVVKTYNDNSTLVSTYSSASGNPVDSGVTNLFTGTIYARKGKDGRAGGKGGVGPHESESYDPSSSNGEDVFVPYQSEPFKGGKAYTTNRGFGMDSADQTAYYSYECGGGGAADGNNGGVSYQTGNTAYKYYFIGGAGANAAQQTNVYTEYGSGGFGGNGGGGGGGAGVIIAYHYANNTYETESQTPGLGGSGSAGTLGIDGCLLIYY